MANVSHEKLTELREAVQTLEVRLGTLKSNSEVAERDYKAILEALEGVKAYREELEQEINSLGSGGAELIEFVLKVVSESLDNLNEAKAVSEGYMKFIKELSDRLVQVKEEIAKEKKSLDRQREEVGQERAKMETQKQDLKIYRKRLEKEYEKVFPGKRIII